MAMGFRRRRPSQRSNNLSSAMLQGVELFKGPAGEDGSFSFTPAAPADLVFDPQRRRRPCGRSPYRPPTGFSQYGAQGAASSTKAETGAATPKGLPARIALTGRTERHDRPKRGSRRFASDRTASGGLCRGRWPCPLFRHRERHCRHHRSCGAFLWAKSRGRASHSDRQREP